MKLRISSTNRSAAWIAAEYNNQNSPGTFITMGSESCPSATPTPTPTAYTERDSYSYADPNNYTDSDANRPHLPHARHQRYSTPTATGQPTPPGIQHAGGK